MGQGQLQLDIVAVSAHPDDCEIGCGGTLAKAAGQGYSVGIFDLTDGEPTPGSPSPEVRLAEAREAGQILGLSVRETLTLPNRRLFDTFDARVTLAKLFRTYRPKLVLCMGGKTVTASPDHLQSQLIVEGAVFYSRLTKWSEHFGELPVHQIGGLAYWATGLSPTQPFPPNAFVVDVSESFEKKMEAIAAYKSQFPPEKREFLDRIRAYGNYVGAAAGSRYGELFFSPRPIITGDIMATLRLTTP